MVSINPAGGSTGALTEPELRQISVFFCDLVGSTPLAQTMDAEDYHELIQDYQRTVGEIIRQYEGNVARTFGDGILAFFGHPVAHEDDAERSIRAGHDAIQAMQRANAARPGQPPLAIRVGIHTGPAIISRAAASDGGEVQALGDAVNLAARLQGFAEPDTAVVSGATLKLVPGLFLTQDLGEPPLKGIKQPVRVHQVLAATGAQTRLEAAESLTPFVGRKRELDLLDDRWRRAARGDGQAVLLSAEPGMGKSRLLKTLREQIEKSAPWLECRCSPLARNTAFSPLLDLLNRSLRTPGGAADDIRLAALEGSLRNSGEDPNEAVPLLAPLLNMKLSGAYAPAEFGADLKRRKTLGVLSRWCLGQAANGPAALVVEDLHWADPSTVEVLGTLIEQVPPRTMMVVPSARPEFSAVWSGWPQFSTLVLEPFNGDEIAIIVDSITGYRPLPAPVRDRLLRQAGGVPLFLEEATKALLESGQLVEQDGRLELIGRLDHLSIPATLQDTLMARLDRLGEAKPLIQTCAVIGREIPLRLLSQVVDLDEAALKRQLRALADAQLLLAQGDPSDATYVFRHALIQDAAYQSIWKKARARLHERVARALETHFPQQARAEPERLAMHFEAAGNIKPAIAYRKAAGKLAARSSFQEATQHAQQALKLAAALPEGEERLKLELDVNLMLTGIVAAAGVVGTANPDAVYARVRELCAQIKDPVLLGTALSSIWIMHYQRCDFATTLELGAQLLELARQAQQPGLVANAWFAHGFVHFSRGDQRAALACVRNAEAVTDDARDSPEMHRAYDLVLPRQFIEVKALTLLGYPDQALRVAREMVARADATQQPFLRLFARGNGMAGALMLSGQWETLHRDWAPEIKRLAERIGDRDHLTDCRWHDALALCALGRLDEALPLYREAVAEERRWQSRLWHSFIHGQVAGTLVRAGRLDEAREALAEAFEVVDRYGERFWEADLHRVRAELRQAERADGTEIQACYDRALAVARAQETKPQELRAATSLARFWRDRGRAADARALLAPVRAWFTEGFELADLQWADALLAEL